MEENNIKQKMSKSKKIILTVIAVLLGLSMLLVATYGVLYFSGSRKFHDDDTNITLPSNQSEIKIDENEVKYKGKTYYLNENIISVLCMGIDKKSVKENLGYGKNGQADCIFLATLDTQTKKITIIPISRETMTDVNQYSVDGEYLGTAKEQVCLAYSYGNSAESSAENVKTSVSRILYGINIASYVTVDLNGVSAITNAMGGITLSSIEDFKSGNKVIKSGQQLTLKGNNAIGYIQSRGSDIEANNRRMLRQKQFLTALISKAGKDVLSDFGKLSDYYNALKPYTSTDLSFSQITYLVSNCLSKDIGNGINFESPTGKTTLGEKWVEFTPDSEAMLEIVMSVFYTEKK